MLRPEALFVPATRTFETEDDELRAVASGEKALAWFPMTREQVEEYSDHDELVSLATTAGLTVITWPREGPSRPPSDVVAIGGEEVLDVFVLRPHQSWRAHAFRACLDVLGRYQWSDSSEYLHSAFLGYTEESCRRWIARQQYNRRGWVGQTVYSLMEMVDLLALAPLGFRCFPPGSATAARTVFRHPDGFLLREDLETVLPAGELLVRFALENEFFLRILGAVPSAQLGVSAEELNCRLKSPIEVWSREGWLGGLPEEGP